MEESGELGGLRRIVADGQLFAGFLAADRHREWHGRQLVGARSGLRDEGLTTVGLRILTNLLSIGLGKLKLNSSVDEDTSVDDLDFLAQAREHDVSRNVERAINDHEDGRGDHEGGIFIVHVSKRCPLSIDARPLTRRG